MAIELGKQLVWALPRTLPSAGGPQRVRARGVPAACGMRNGDNCPMEAGGLPPRWGGRTGTCATSGLLRPVQGGPGRPAGHRGGPPPGLRPARSHDQGDRASGDRTGMQLRAPDQGRRPGRRGGAGGLIKPERFQLPDQLPPFMPCCPFPRRWQGWPQEPAGCRADGWATGLSQAEQLGGGLGAGPGGAVGGQVGGAVRR